VRPDVNPITGKKSKLVFVLSVCPDLNPITEKTRLKFFFVLSVRPDLNPITKIEGVKPGIS